MGLLPDESFRQANPCMNCGACCIVFRASFYWAEGDDAMEKGVPAAMTVRAGLFRRAMRRGRNGRCIALRGRAGRRVFCEIYERRPSVCRNFEPAWKAGRSMPCEMARKRLGFSSWSAKRPEGHFRAHETLMTAGSKGANEP